MSKQQDITFETSQDTAQYRWQLVGFVERREEFLYKATSKYFVPSSQIIYQQEIQYKCCQTSCWRVYELLPIEYEQEFELQPLGDD